MWNSQQNSSRDSYGNFAKFSYPTIANGKVYVPTFGTAISGSGSLYVYGLLNTTVVAPSAPTNAVASAGNAQVQVTWGAPATGTAPFTYNIYRGTSPGGESTTALATNVTSPYTDTTAANGTTYYYTVKAINSAGTSPASNEVSGTPSGGTTSTNVISIACGNSAVSPFVADVDFSGGAVSSGTTTTINTSGVTNPAPMSVYQHGRKGTFTYTIPGLTAGASYGVRLDFCEYAHTAAGQRQFNVSINGTQVLTNFDIFAAAGAEFKANAQSFTATANASGQIVITFTTVLDNALVAGIEISTTGSVTAPTAPTNLVGTPSDSAVSLTWTGVSGATSYSIYRGTTAGGESPTAVGSTTAPTVTFNNTALTNGTKYYFTVKAFNSAGSSPASNEASATPVATVTAPSAPTLSGSAGNGSITLNWTASTGTAPISYAVYQGTTSGGEGATPVASGISTTTYTNTGYTNGTTYFFKVVATNSAGSATSNEISLTPSSGVTGIDLLVTSITWTPSTPAAGSQVVFTATIKNQGNTATPAGTIIGVQFAVDGKATPITWNDKDTTSLGAGQSVVLTATGGTNSVNYWPATSGSHTVQAWVDDVNRIAESNETNNKATATFSVP